MSSTPEERTKGDGQMEKRQLKRRHLIYYLRVFDGLSSRVVGHVVDISHKGLMLISDEPIAVHEEYRLRMRFPGVASSQEELIFDASCRWCRQDENPAFYVAGFQIRDLLAEETKFIQSLIDEFGV
jgi:hypothetical protein